MNTFSYLWFAGERGLVLLNIIANANAYSQSEPWPARIIFEEGRPYWLEKGGNLQETLIK